MCKRAFVLTCRYIYQRQAAKEAGKDVRMLGLPFAHEWLRDKGHNFKTQFGAVAGAVDIMQVQRQSQQLGQQQPQAVEAFFQQRMGQVGRLLLLSGCLGRFIATGLHDNPAADHLFSLPSQQAAAFGQQCCMLACAPA